MLIAAKVPGSFLGGADLIHEALKLNYPLVLTNFVHLPFQFCQKYLLTYEVVILIWVILFC